jgi:pimeloyl-ACP methyl ester carboxylesterase
MTAALLIHGAGVGCACWDIDTKDYSMMELLAREGFDVFAVDQRGLWQKHETKWAYCYQ